MNINSDQSISRFSYVVSGIDSLPGFDSNDSEILLLGVTAAGINSSRIEVRGMRKSREGRNRMNPLKNHSGLYCARFLFANQ